MQFNNIKSLPINSNSYSFGSKIATENQYDTFCSQNNKPADQLKPEILQRATNIQEFAGDIKQKAKAIGQEIESLQQEGISVQREVADLFNWAQNETNKPETIEIESGDKEGIKILKEYDKNGSLLRESEFVSTEEVINHQIENRYRLCRTCVYTQEGKDIYEYDILTSDNTLCHIYKSYQDLDVDDESDIGAIAAISVHFYPNAPEYYKNVKYPVSFDSYAPAEEAMFFEGNMLSEYFINHTYSYMSECTDTDVAMFYGKNGELSEYYQDCALYDNGDYSASEALLFAESGNLTEYQEYCNCYDGELTYSNRILFNVNDSQNS